MDRVFRIRQWKSGGSILPGRFSEFKKGNRLLYDEQRLYDRKIKMLKRQADMLNAEYIRLAITGEEFLDGVWRVVYHYPEEFEFELHAR